MRRDAGAVEDAAVDGAELARVALGVDRGRAHVVVAEQLLQIERVESFIQTPLCKGTPESMHRRTKGERYAGLTRQALEHTAHRVARQAQAAVGRGHTPKQRHLPTYW